MSILRIVRTYRSLQRLRHMVKVVTKHGLGSYVDRLHLARFLPMSMSFRRQADRESSEPAVKRLTKALQELGPTTVKFGQMLASRPDLLPPEYLNEFTTLQDRADTFPSEEARKIIETELGKPVDELFSKFNDEPAGAASIAQVHEATLHDGTSVMVKVRRPGIREMVHADIDLLRAIVELTDRYLPELKILNPSLVVEEFARNIRREMDFLGEAAYTARFHEEFRDDERIITPRVFWDFTSSAILTIERLEGIRITEAADLEDPPFDKAELADNLSSVFMKQFFNTGIFHGDPHGGNILVTPTGTLCLLDFGLVGHLSRDLREQLVTMFIALDRKDFDTIVDVLVEAGVTSAQTDLNAFKRDLIEMSDRYLGIPVKRISIMSLFNDLAHAARNNSVRLPRDFVLLGKSMAMVGGLAKKLDPEFSLASKMGPYTRALIEERLEPAKILDRSATGLWHLLRFISKLPSEAGQIIRKLRTGTLEIVFRHEGLEDSVAELDKASNRLSLSVILGSVVVASSLIINAKIAPLIPDTDISILGLVGYCIAAIMGIWLVLAIIRSGRL